MEETISLLKQNTPVAVMILIAVIYLSSNMSREHTELRAEMAREHTAIRAEMNHELSEFRTEMNREHTEIRAEMSRKHTEIRGDITDLRERMSSVEAMNGKIMDNPAR